MRTKDEVHADEGGDHCPRCGNGGHYDDECPKTRRVRLYACPDCGRTGWTRAVPAACPFYCTLEVTP